MKCPYCGKEMERGYLYGGNRIIWTQDEIRFTALAGERDIQLAGWGFFGSRIPAETCKGCHKVIVDYEE